MSTSRDPHLVVVGASLAGLRAVTEARALGHVGPITLVGAEKHLPYDRPPLSKELLAPGALTTTHVLPESAELEGPLRVRVLTSTEATGIEVARRELAVRRGTGDHEVIGYDEVLIATGARPRDLPGSTGLAGVEVLRTIDDALRIRSALDRGAQTVIVGGGFIGAEVASAAVRRGLTPTIVEAAPVPLVRALGETAGQALSRLHERRGSRLICGVGVAELVGDGSVSGVRLTDGSEIPADLVVVGIGAEPCTGWLEGSGLALDDGVVCDSHLRAGPHVWAAGDVARWSPPGLGRTIRLEHWTNAGDQAAHAVANLLDPATAAPYDTVPYFWSDWYGEWIQFAGVPAGEPEVVVGGWDGESVLALYREGERLAGVLAVNRRGDVMKFRALLARRATYDDALKLAWARKARSA